MKNFLFALACAAVGLTFVIGVESLTLDFMEDSLQLKRWVYYLLFIPFFEEGIRFFIGGKLSRQPIVYSIFQALYEAPDLVNMFQGAWHVHVLNGMLLQYTGSKKRIFLLAIPIHMLWNFPPSLALGGLELPFLDYNTARTIKSAGMALAALVVLLALWGVRMMKEEAEAQVAQTLQEALAGLKLTNDPKNNLGLNA